MECCKHNHSKMNEEKNNLKLVINILGILLLILNFSLKIEGFIELIIYSFSYLLIGYEIIINAIKSIFKKNAFDENVLMTIATVGAFFIGEYIEGIAVLLFYKVGESLQEFAVNKSKKRIEKALNLKPDYANLKINENEFKKVDPIELKTNDIIVVKTGEKIPVDGIIVNGNSLLDISVLTGESLPKEVIKNDEVLSGSINIDTIIEIKVTKTYDDSTISKIINMIKNATNNKSETEKFITKFAKIYTPIVVAIAILIAILPPLFINTSFEEYIRRALIFLVVSCPCALMLSIPLGYFVGIGTCGKKGILIKGSNYLDGLANIDSIVFDKTGTLTKGKFIVSKIVSTSDIKEEKIIEYVALSESFSNHPIAKSILEYYNKKIEQSRIKNHKEISGYGIKATIDENNIIVGNYKLLDKEKINYIKPDEIGTLVYLVVNNKYMGYVVVIDELKVDSKKTINKLKEYGIKTIVMLTGDNKKIANAIGYDLNLTNVYSELLPEDKVIILKQIKENKKSGNVVFIGDGINDSPVLATSDIGISMSSGSDIAIETSDIVLMTNEPYKIIDAIDISRQTKKIVVQNIIFAITIKILFLIISGLGYTNMWLAIFADVGVSLLAVLNSTRIMKLKK